MRATRIIWQGAGSHMPHEGDGTPIPPRDPSTLAPCCAMCGERGPRWTADDAFSDNFRPLSHLSQLYPHVVEGFPVSLCAACVWSSRALRLRCAASFSRTNGVWFVARRHLLSALLDPPEPPFVACAPLYGADHGGETHGWRATWPGEPPLPDGVDVLTRLQAKHVAAYADVALSRTRYPLQWDDHTRVMVDVPLWRDLAARLGACAAALRGASVGVTDTRSALATLRAPVRAPIAVHRAWPSLVRGLDAHRRAPWWPLLADLLPLPEAPPRPEKAPPTASVAVRPTTPAPTPPPHPAATPEPATSKPPLKAQLSLF